MAELKSSAILPYVLGVSEPFRRCLEQQGIRVVFKSGTTLRSNLLQPRDTVDTAKQDAVVYRIPFECDKVFIAKIGRPNNPLFLFSSLSPLFLFITLFTFS